MRRVLPVSAVSLLVGFLAGQARGPAVLAQAPAPKAAFLIANSRAIQRDKLGPYRQAAAPLAAQAGAHILGSGDPTLHVLEGKWPYQDASTLTVEQYRSMDDLLAFWNSEGYQNAKQLRAGIVETHFIVAVEGR
jgi:uncharacterized protein (DUF1330 family)